ncbi:MAG: acetate kinase, partial [Actinobacteria bacterium]|nr:acetate kinase [Actinomycetota bacterium]
MKVLVLNCGSSSIKYQLHDADHHVVLADGMVSRIGEDPAIPDHGRALELILESLLDPTTVVVKDLSEVS